METIRILILEDDLKTLSVITGGLFDLEESLFDERINFAITVFSEYKSVENYLNLLKDPDFDVILLDRDCKLAGSFHAINVVKFGADKFIAISTQPEYNEAAEKMGVTRIIRKDYERLDDFRSLLIKEISQMIFDGDKKLS
ncbi:MAG: hypothetical protein NTZ65_02645 [Candidatus Berkelbacteria bacterium]|nr:hypothetical protein [Candidatus Berkelbacteria bacterium]